MSLKDSWKKAGVGIGHAAKDLGKAFADTAKTSVRKVNDWANGDEEGEQKEKKNVVEAEVVEAEIVPSDHR